ncbi:MAG: FHA domain-containing protein [Anaerolineae bacterium]|nr:FHA domain-containing protein [Anaerolineae bacterium]
MTIICPSCQHQEYEGALFCSECGTKLISDDGLATASIRPTDASITEPSSIHQPAETPLPALGAKVSLHIVQTGQISPLIGKDEFTIGRMSEGQSILPDIDLSPYDAYTHGVSRLHATIKVEDDSVLITDLGSSNGTRINKTKIAAHQDHPVSHGDVIALGRFKIQVLIRQDD